MLIYRPLRVFLGFISIVFLIDTLILMKFVSPIFSFGAVFLIPLIWAWWPTSKLIKVGNDGWDIGEGVNLQDPRNPNKQRIVLQDTVLKLGFLGLGSPGSGKTVSLAVGLLHYYSVTFFERTKKRIGWGYLEGKGDKEIYQLAVASGAKPDFFFSSELKSSDTINLFVGLPNDVIEIWSKILIPDSTNEFYANEQKRVLQIVIPLLKSLATAKGVEVSLRDLYILLRHPEAPIKVMAEARAYKLPDALITISDEYFKEKYEERQNAIKGLMNKLFVFVDGERNERINAYNAKIDLSKAVNNSKRIYFHLPLTNYSKDLSFAICETFSAIARDRQNYSDDRQLWPMTFDDWGGFFYDGFSKTTARIRSASMPANFMFQSKGQMDEIDSTFADQIDDTVSTKIFLRIMGEATRNWASKMMGSFDDMQLSISNKDDSQMDGSNIGYLDKPRIKPEEFKGLNDGEAIISTTVKHKGGRVDSLNLKGRFPLLQPEIDPKTIDWPICHTLNLDNTPGLNLWNEYMTQDYLPVAEKFYKSDKSEEKEQGQEPTKKEKFVEIQDIEEILTESDEDIDQW